MWLEFHVLQHGLKNHKYEAVHIHNDTNTLVRTNDVARNHEKTDHDTAKHLQISVFFSVKDAKQAEVEGVSQAWQVGSSLQQTCGWPSATVWNVVDYILVIGI